MLLIARLKQVNGYWIFGVLPNKKIELIGVELLPGTPCCMGCYYHSYLHQTVMDLSVLVDLGLIKRSSYLNHIDL